MLPKCLPVLAIKELTRQRKNWRCQNQVTLTARGELVHCVLTNRDWKLIGGLQDPLRASQFESEVLYRGEVATTVLTFQELLQRVRKGCRKQKRQSSPYHVQKVCVGPGETTNLMEWLVMRNAYPVALAEPKVRGIAAQEFRVDKGV